MDSRLAVDDVLTVCGFLESQSTHALEVALNTMPVGVSWARVSDQAVMFVNRTFTEMFGYSKADFNTIDHFIEKSYPLQGDRDLARRKWGEYFQRPDLAEFPVEPIEVSLSCQNGELKIVMVSGIILPQTGWALATFVDLTEHKKNELRLSRAQEQASENEALFRLLLEHSPEMIVLSPFDSKQRYVSPAVERITGFTSEEYLSLRGYDQFHEDDRMAARMAIEAVREGRRHQSSRLRLLTKEGSYRWVEACLSGYKGPSCQRVLGYVATIRDISQQVSEEQAQAAEQHRLREAANQDELTKLANRRAFNVSFHREAQRRSLSNHDLSLLLFDIDRFKSLNDTYGHPAGDECLRRVAGVLINTLGGEQAMIARFGGEEFVVLLPETFLDNAAQAAERVRLAVEDLELFLINGVSVSVTISAGVACWSADLPGSEDSLLAHADSALYVAKHLGRNAVHVWCH